MKEKGVYIAAIGLVRRLSSEKFKTFTYFKNIRRRCMTKLNIESVTKTLSVLFLNSSEKTLVLNLSIMIRSLCKISYI